MNRIKRVSLFFKWVFLIVLIALPMLTIVSWIYAPDTLVLLAGFIKVSAIPANYAGMHLYTLPGAHFGPTSTGVVEKALLHSLTVKEKIIGCLISMIPTFISMFITYSLIKLFDLYAKGDIFSIKHVKYIRNIGYALLLGQIIEPFYQFAMGVVLTMNNPIHYRYASITLDQNNVGILLTSLLVILISWIMAEGYQLREEQRLTI
jgi:hypothetical protein